MLKKFCCKKYEKKIRNTMQKFRVKIPYRYSEILKRTYMAPLSYYLDCVFAKSKPIQLRS